MYQLSASNDLVEKDAVPEVPAAQSDSDAGNTIRISSNACRNPEVLW